ncbi:MAG: PBSX family phage terminase large subunit, partial [Candidatus Pelethousia sp.]|nr:PBSX family phage terminase large subunit [Candidatus Pelethousia sp.]
RHKKAYDEARLALEARSQGATTGGGATIIPDAVWRDLMNEAYAEHLTDDRQTQIYFGGSSSGKSFAILGQRVVRDLMRGERNYLICRKTARTLRNSCFNEVKKCISRMELTDQFNINKSDMVITHKGSGRQILFAGLDDVEKVKSLTPAEGVLTDVLIEEATEVDYADYKQLRKRLRGGDSGVSKRVTLLFNPVTQDHWIYTEFFAGCWDDEAGVYSDKDLLILRTTYKANRFLTAEDIAALENETDKYYYDVYTLGKWGVLGKLIFTNWTTKDLSAMAAQEAKPRNGLDFGFWPDPNAYVRAGYNRGKGEVYIYRTAGGNHQDNAALAGVLRPIVAREVVRCDNDLLNIHELNNFGIRAIPANKGPGSVAFGIKWLQRQKIFVDPSCVDIILELQKYKYKEDRNGNILPEPVDRDNHWIDGLRYALEDDMLETKVS